MRSGIASALRALFWFEAGLATAAYAGVAGLLLADVLSREIFGEAIWGAQKIAVFGAIIAGFLGLVLSTASNSHLRPQFADGWFPRAWSPGVDRAGDVFSGMLYIGFAIVAVGYVEESIVARERAAVLYTPLWPIQIVLPYAFFSSALRHLSFAAFPGLKPAARPEAG
ncbi:MAG: TRAP transporter small permease [Rhodospirillaceae bacterium]|nr:TRAP transporter small permease [Rhodospirillaceae bacterium]